MTTTPLVKSLIDEQVADCNETVAIPAQGEREARDWEMKAQGIESVIHCVVSRHDQDVLRRHAADKRAEGRRLALRLMQAEQQPIDVIAYRTLDRYGNPVTDWIDGDPAGGEPIVKGGSFQLAYAALVSQPAQPEQQPIYQIRPRENVRDWCDVNVDGYRAAQAMASMEARKLYVAPVAQPAQTELVEALTKHRIALIPEYEDQWHADLYGDEGHALFREQGATPEEAVKAVIATLAAQGGE